MPHRIPIIEGGAPFTQNHTMSENTQIKLWAYKINDLARIEWVHPQTILNRKKRGIYVTIVIRSGKESKESYRYLTAEASNAFRAIFATLWETVNFCPEIPQEPETEAEEIKTVEKAEEPKEEHETDTF